ncbi:hypothetical protein PLICRDRAFT_35026 [Plicaturopsis crispa FD-325 SS-3]|nr:hypothetical protein PLICRDRAFT_35026 [Plicaturopsis crispa FD-325 SS-3]
MNGVNDHKRTSISQLLNPAAAHEHPFAPQVPLSASARSIQAQRGPPDVAAYQQHQQYAPESPFNLRAASWSENQGGDPSKRRPEPYPRYHQGPDEFADHASRMTRGRMDEQQSYGMDAGPWVPNDMGGVSYGAPPSISPMYSDERTSLSGDYGSNGNHYNQGYQEPPQHPPPQQTWQNAERVSVRLAARGTAPDQVPQQSSRYNNMPPAGYYPPQNMAGYPPMSYPHQQQHPQQQQQQHPSQSHPHPHHEVPAQLPPQAQPQKRPAPEEDEPPAPKPKKAKAKPKTPAEGGSSKRGYNAKKRSEAAQIAAQNAQLMPTVSYAQDKGKERAAGAPMTIVAGSNVQSPTSSGPLHPELQFARCMSNRYKSEMFPRCVSCTRRWAGDTCRFQGIRFFLKDAQRNIVGISFVENQKPDAPNMIFPTSWNISLKPIHIRRVKRTIAKALLPTLREELEHLNMPQIIRRPRESDVRATCDTCMTSIFSSSWMCRLCGREACAECFKQVKDLTEDRPGSTQLEMAALQARREKQAHSNPFFLSCTRRNEHQSKDFSPMSRFCKDELAAAISDMEALIEKPDEDALPVVNGAIDPSLDAPNSGPSTSTPAANDASTSANGHGPDASADGSHPGASAAAEAARFVPSEGASSIPTHPIKYFMDADLTDDVFRPIWAQGEPLVVTGLLPKFQIQWDPDYFIQKHDSQSCLIVECQSDKNNRVTVGEFFRMFAQYEGRTDCWKLKDWPSSADFKVAFPELYDDFSRAVPVPNYVRRDGVLNIASHFPSNTVAPDLGPKMYNAMASNQSPGSKGSTRLHMDMADALNIMTFASPTPSGQPGCAAWDLYRADDSDKIRQFLRKRFKGSYQHDPIHSQQFYMDEDMRQQLFEDYGVKSYRVYQRPGDAVFIPAGSAHQVCNLADCVKVAVDFVSPENIDRCEKLTREFREQNQSMVWKEDVLQLRTMMWFAWLSCCRQEN